MRSVCFTGTSRTDSIRFLFVAVKDNLERVITHLMLVHREERNAPRVPQIKEELRLHMLFLLCRPFSPTTKLIFAVSSSFTTGAFIFLGGEEQFLSC